VVILQTAEQLLNRPVIGIEGFEIGEIKDFEIQIGTWEITGLVIALSKEAIKEIGLKKRILTPRACIPISAISNSSGKILLNKTLKELYEKNPDVVECPREAFL
jgi:sporulation protein YlmC with PRC-barrel domain